MTNEEKRFLNAIANLGCALCRKMGYGESPCEIHHIRNIGLGMGVRNSNTNVIGLCPEHHRGATGFHGMGRKAFERKYGVTQEELLQDTLDLLDDGK